MALPCSPTAKPKTKNIQRKHSLLDIEFSVISPVHPVGLSCERLMTGGAPNLALEGPSLHAKAPGLGGASEFALVGLGTDARLSPSYVQSSDLHSRQASVEVI